MSAIPYTDLPKAGIHNPSDLMHFDWDKEGKPSEDDVDELATMLEEERKRLNL